MYTFRQLLRGITNPSRAAEEINEQFAKHVLSRVRPGTDVFEEDWDNLILLDACRYDLLSEYEFNEGRVEWRWSGGSHSKEFLEYNVAGKMLDDVVWITANPWVSTYSENIFRVVNLWDTGWDKEHQTVLPETMETEARRVASEYSNKRIVVHFMQPHYPFIGETGQSKLPQHRTFTGDGIIKADDDTGMDIWEQLKAGFVERDVVWQAYQENLERVLPAARRLVHDLYGKSVLSADHGNEFGGLSSPIPYRLYGHPSGYRTKNLIKVPWVVIEDKERRSINPGQIEAQKKSQSTGMSEKLSSLGYIQE